jgi:lipoyl(octanoyl) transferase
LNVPSLIVRQFGVLDYQPVWQAMRALVDTPNALPDDEIWFLQHSPVFTLGQAGRREHLLDPGDFPVIASDRGGQVTYHGPGQLVAYLLVGLKRRSMGVKRLVHGLEQAVIDLLAASRLEGVRRTGAPGVYLGGRKLAAIGLRIRNGFSYHGLAVNVDGDLAPFGRIDPCGYAGLKATRLKDLGLSWSVEETATRLLPYLADQLGCPAGSIIVDEKPTAADIRGLPQPGPDRSVAGAGG